MIAQRAAERRISGLERIQDRALGRRTFDLKLHFAFDARQNPQMRRQYDSNHDSVCTSTESTAGRSRTIGAQESPASADA